MNDQVEKPVFTRHQQVRLLEAVSLRRKPGWGTAVKIIPARSIGHVDVVICDPVRPIVAVRFSQYGTVHVHAHQLESVS